MIKMSKKNKQSNNKMINKKICNNIDLKLLTSSIGKKGLHYNDDLVYLGGHILYFEPNKKFSFVCNVCKTRHFKRLKEFFKHFKKCYATKESNESTIANNNEINSIESNNSQNVLETIYDDNADIEIGNYPENNSHWNFHSETQFTNSLDTTTSPTIDEKLYDLLDIDESSIIREEEEDVSEIVTNFSNDSSDLSNEIIFYNELSSDIAVNSSQILEKDDINNDDLLLDNENDNAFQNDSEFFSSRKKRKTVSESNIDYINKFNSTNSNNDIHTFNNITNDGYITIENNNYENGFNKNHSNLNGISTSSDLKNEDTEIFEDAESSWTTEMNEETIEETKIISNHISSSSSSIDKNNIIKEGENNFSKDLELESNGDTSSNNSLDNDFSSNENSNETTTLNIIDNCEIIVEQDNSEFDDLPSFNVICEKCKGQFSTIEELQKHRKILNPFNPSIYECDLGYIVKEKQTANELLNLIGKTSFPCLYCNKNYLKKSHLEEHERTSHIKETPYDCIYCKKKFVTSIARKDHENLHVKKKK